jgi:hypothetical protein
MFRQRIIIIDLPNHLYIELLLSISKSRFKNNEIVGAKIILKVNSIGKRRHFATRQVNPAFDFARTITEFEHVRVVFTTMRFKTGHD